MGTWMFLFALTYPLPMLIAIFRRHRNALPISVLNLLVGWTSIAWIIALIWSLTANVHPAPAAAAQAPKPKPRPALDDAPLGTAAVYRHPSRVR